MARGCSNALGQGCSRGCCSLSGCVILIIPLFILILIISLLISCNF
ncbi:hypothetical protein ES708_17690 [subsurface metagenome]